MYPSRRVFLGVGIIGVGCFGATVTAQSVPDVPHWKPDKALAKQLDAAVKVEGYSLQPPKNYPMQKGNAPAGMKAFAWVGAARTDGTQPTLMLGLIVPPAGEAAKYTLEQLADKLLAGVKRRRTDWQQGKTETGSVNGLTFARIRWTGTQTPQGLKMQGFLYVARDGATIIQLTSQDVVPAAKQALPLVEASVLTFKKL